MLCGQHKFCGMINVGVAQCEITTCHKQPSFNFHNQKKAFYCAEHKKPGATMCCYKTKRREILTKKIPCRCNWPEGLLVPRGRKNTPGPGLGDQSLRLRSLAR